MKANLDTYKILLYTDKDTMMVYTTDIDGTIRTNRDAIPSEIKTKNTEK